MTLKREIEKRGKIAPAERAEFVRELTGKFVKEPYDKINKAVREFNGWLGGDSGEASGG